MSFIEFINYIISNVIGTEFQLIGLTSIAERVSNATEWQRLLFDYELITSLIVYFALFYFIYYILMYLPYKLIKRLLNQK